jgi:hypothetical protein
MLAKTSERVVLGHGDRSGGSDEVGPTRCAAVQSGRVARRNRGPQRVGLRRAIRARLVTQRGAEGRFQPRVGPAPRGCGGRGFPHPWIDKLGLRTNSSDSPALRFAAVLAELLTGASFDLYKYNKFRPPVPALPSWVESLSRLPSQPKQRPRTRAYCHTSRS